MIGRSGSNIPMQPTSRQATDAKAMSAKKTLTKITSVDCVAKGLHEHEQ